MKRFNKNEWRKVRIEEVFKKVISGEWGEENIEDSENTVYIIRTTNFKNDGSIDIKEKEVIKRKIEKNKIIDKKLEEKDIIIEKSGGSPNQPVGRVVYFNLKADKEFLCNNFTSILRTKDEIESKYIYYFLQKCYKERKVLKFQNKTTGIINLKLQDYLRNTQVYLPSLDEQKRIVKIMDKVFSIIKFQQEKLLKLEKLSKCLFFEMFGDPILNEKKWNIFNFSQVCEINPSKSELENIDNNTEVSFIPMSSVSTKGEVLTKEIKRFEEVKIGFTYFKEKDVLFAKITPCMENGKGGIAKNLKNGIGFGSTEFHVLRPKDKVSNSYWVYYISMLPFFRKNAEKIMTGSGGQKRVPISYFKNVIIGLPPIELQNKFAERIKLIEKSKFIFFKNYKFLGVEKIS